MQLLTNFTSKAAEQKQPVCPAKLNLGTVFNRGGKDEWFSTGRRNSLVYIAVYCIGGDYPLLSRLEYQINLRNWIKTVFEDSLHNLPLVIFQ